MTCYELSRVLPPPAATIPIWPCLSWRLAQSADRKKFGSVVWAIRLLAPYLPQRDICLNGSGRDNAVFQGASRVAGTGSRSLILSALEGVLMLDACLTKSLNLTQRSTS